MNIEELRTKLDEARSCVQAAAADITAGLADIYIVDVGEDLELYSLEDCDVEELRERDNLLRVVSMRFEGDVGKAGFMDAFIIFMGTAFEGIVSEIRAKALASGIKRIGVIEKPAVALHIDGYLLEAYVYALFYGG